jgi:poly(3-hydroxybutyrate) depolymerase
VADGRGSTSADRKGIDDVGFAKAVVADIARAHTVDRSRVNDGTSVTRRVYPGCRAGTEVTWYEIQGGGHRWPPHRPQGIKEVIARREVGVSSQNIDASDVRWTFFAAHPKR